MAKRTFFLMTILFLIGGGFLYWENQADVRALNKALPEGVRVDKCSLSGEWRVINKIDEYEFKVPEEWKGLEEIEYFPEETEWGYTASSLGIEGNEGAGRIVGIDRYKTEIQGVDLGLWAKTNFETFELVSDFSEDEVGEFDVVKTQENVHLGGMYVYFFKKDSAIYAITCGSEEFIKEIILNGKW